MKSAFKLESSWILKKIKRFFQVESAGRQKEFQGFPLAGPG